MGPQCKESELRSGGQRWEKQRESERIKPLCDHCLSIFPQYFIPPEIFTLDETMVRFKGRSSYKTVIKANPLLSGAERS